MSFETGRIFMQTPQDYNTINAISSKNSYRTSRRNAPILNGTGTPTGVNTSSISNVRGASIGMPRLAGSIVIGGAATFSIFVLMHHLISNDDIHIPVVEPMTFISSVYEEKDESLNTDRKEIKPPPEVITPPDRIVEPIVTSEVIGIGLIDEIGLTIEPVGNDSKITGFGQTSDARPIVRIDPEYPPVASRDGIEGWVELSFSIDESGAVQNVNVTDSEPKRIFDRAAKRALQRWKYQPKREQGKTVVQEGLSVILEFKMST